MESKAPGLNMLMSAEDIEFFRALDETISLVVSASDCSDDNIIKENVLLSPIRSDGSSSWSPSISFPDYKYDEALLDELNLQSLGDKETAKKVLSKMLATDSILLDGGAFSAGRGRVALQRINAELRTDRREIDELRTEIGRMKERLDDNKASMRDLNISEALYNKLSRLPEDELTVREFVCVKAAEIYMPLREENDRLQRALDETRRSLEHSTATLQAQTYESSRLKKSADAQLESLRLELNTSEERVTRLQAALDEERSLRRDYEEKAKRCQAAEQEALTLRREVFAYTESLTQQKEALRVLSDSEAKLKLSVTDLERLRDMLQLDKSYLQQQLLECTAKYDDAMRKADTYHSNAQSLEIKVQQLTDQMLEMQLLNSSSFNERLEKEMKRIRDESSRELMSMRETSREISEKENRILREIRASLEQENDSQRRKIESLNADNLALYKEQQSIKSVKDNEIIQLQTELKLKNFELTSLGASYEERMSQMKQYQLEVDTLHEEIAAYKMAIFQLENDMANKTQNLQNQLEQSQSQLREALKRREWNDENESLARPPKPQEFQECVQQDDDNFEEQVVFAKRMLESRSYYASLTNDTRYKHVTSLARKFLRQFDENYNLKLRLRRLVDEKEELAEKLGVANRTATLANHPTKYVLEKLAVKEEELLTLSRKHRHLEEKIDVLEAEMDKSHAECSDLKERLRLLLSQRSELENLKNYLMSMNDNEGNDDDVVDTSTIYPEDPSVLAASQESLDEPAVIIASPRKQPQTPKPDTPRSSPRKSDPTNNTTIQSLNLTPEAIRRMTERTPSKNGSPSKRVGFHMRTPL